MKDTTTQVTCYKLVLRRLDHTLVSLTAQCLPQGWAVEYVVGEPAYPPLTGELFAFDTESSALSFKRALHDPSRRIELYQALAQLPVCSIDSVCSLPAWEDDLHDFWNLRSLYDPARPAPPGTITTRSLTLIKRLL